MQNNGAVGSIVSPALPGQGQPNTPDLHLCDREADKHREVGPYGLMQFPKETDGWFLHFSLAEMHLP